MSRQNQASRREFLRTLSLALGAGGASSILPQLNLMGSAMAASHDSSKAAKGEVGYKALVCIALAGGNDSFNLLMPRDSTNAGSNYDVYRASRGGVYNASTNAQGLGIDFNAMRAIDPIGQPASSFGLHPQCADYNWTVPASGSSLGLQSLFQQGRLAFIANCGTLTEPLSKTEYNNGSKTRPRQLFSHSDQELLWQLANSEANSKTGWGGEAIDAFNLSPTPLPACISVAGSNRFQIGNSVFPYQMNNSGATPLQNYSATSTSNASNARLATLNRLLQASGQPIMTDEYRKLLRRSMDLSTLVNTALTNFGTVTTPYHQTSGTNTTPQVTVNGQTTNNSLLEQLRVVARMIKASRDPASGLGASRQIYYVRLGGFDTHDGQMGNTVQPYLMARISQALGWFWQALNDIGAQNEVVTFSASEFARTLSSNANGSDHAWGGVQFVMGQPVIGRTIYGRYPRLAIDANDDVNQNWSFSRGQFIPTTSVEQISATLATWFGVPQSAFPTIFPNLTNFSSSNLGFLQAV